MKAVDQDLHRFSDNKSMIKIMKLRDSKSTQPRFIGVCELIRLSKVCKTYVTP